MLIPLAIAALAFGMGRKPVRAMSAPAVAQQGAERFDLARPDVAAVVAEAAKSIGVSPAALRSVIRVESSGKPFGADGRLLVRFEPHVFARLTEKAGKRAIVLNQGMKDLANPRRRSGGQAAEWDALGRASSIDPELAFQSASFGLPQVMGFNHRALGYDSARAMFAAFQSSWSAQIRGMAKFIASSPKMLAALRAQKWAEFVAVYNGAKPGSAANAAYTSKLKAEMGQEHGMGGIRFQYPPARRLDRAITTDRGVLLRKQRQSVLRAWMHSGALRSAAETNGRMAKVNGWHVRRPFSGPTDPAFAVIVFRLQQSSGIVPNGILGRRTIAVLRRHVRLGSRIGRWARTVLVLPGSVHGLHGLGAAKPGFAERLASGFMEKAKADKAAADDRKARRQASEDRAREAGLIEGAKAKARAQWQSQMPSNLPAPRLTSKRGQDSGFTRYLPWVLGGVGILAAIMLSRPAPAPQQPMVLAA